MVKDIREQASPILNALKAEKLKAYQRQMRQISLSTPADAFFAVRNTIDDSLDALEANAREWIADAVDRIATVSQTPIALALINEALAVHISNLCQHVEERRLGSHLGTTIRSIDHARLGEIQRRLERQLDGYQDAFARTSSSTVSDVGVKRGPKGKYDWLSATNIVWGKIFRGELIPKKQNDIEEAFVSILAGDDGNLEASNTRDYARPIWQEYNSEPKDDN